MVGETLRNALGHGAILPALMRPSSRSLAGMSVNRSKTSWKPNLEDKLQVDVICCQPAQEEKGVAAPGGDASLVKPI